MSPTLCSHASSKSRQAGDRFRAFDDPCRVFADLATGPSPRARPATERSELGRLSLAEPGREFWMSRRTGRPVRLDSVSCVRRSSKPARSTFFQSPSGLDGWPPAHWRLLDEPVQRVQTSTRLAFAGHPERDQRRDDRFRRREDGGPLNELVLRSSADHRGVPSRLRPDSASSRPSVNLAPVNCGWSGGAV